MIHPPTNHDSTDTVCVDEDDRPLTDDSERQVNNIGQIVLYFYIIETLEAANAAEIPRSDSSETATISQKALKKLVAQGDSLTCQTRYVLHIHSHTLANLCQQLSFPRPNPAAHPLPIHKVRTSSNEPFASFTFYYRSTGTSSLLPLSAQFADNV